MPETNERITVLETNMSYVLAVMDKREEYQASVLKSLTIIEMKQDQALNYQKTCDAERAAIAARTAKIENLVNQGMGASKLFWFLMIAISGTTGCIASIVTIMSVIHH